MDISTGSFGREKGGLQEHVQGVDNARQVTQDGEQDVYEEIGIASALEEDADGWQNDGKNDLANITVSEKISF